jgi:hypothetical protein
VGARECSDRPLTARAHFQCGLYACVWSGGPVSCHICDSTSRGIQLYYVINPPPPHPGATRGAGPGDRTSCISLGGARSLHFASRAQHAPAACWGARNTNTRTRHTWTRTTAQRRSQKSEPKRATCGALDPARQRRVHACARHETLQPGGDLGARVLLAPHVADDVRRAERQRCQDQQQPLKVEPQQ